MVQNYAPVSTLDTLKDLSSQQAIVDFFERRGYSTDGDATLPALESEALLKELHKRDWVQLQVKGFRRIGQREDATGVMRVYLYTVERVTQSLAKEIFRDHCAPGRGDETLAVLVDQDYANIEIVYVDRHAGAAAALQQPLPGMKAKFGKPQFRALSITRLSGSTPNKVVRALNRFFWPTQRSVVVQRALLSSAFDLVEWSEDYFNNRALFSDHYLNRMQDDKDDKEWQSTKESGGEGYLFGNAWNELRTEYEKFQEEYEQLKGAKKTLSLEDRIRITYASAALNIKVLRTLGFVPRPAKQKRDKDGRRIADYSLCERMPDGKASQQLVVCLSYEWDRNLDGYADEDSEPEALDIEALENPGAAVVALLGTERGQSEWAIVTNGKLWRLYSAKAHNRATNYYEIDLQEALAIPREQSEEAKNAFRYFWLFFRARAFIPALHGEEKEPSTFLDYILRQSTQYAVTLGNSLKKKIFDEVFEHFAGSLVHDARRKGTLPTDLTPYSEEEQQRLLKPFFNSTLTFLYRLLFVLYAESRSLLPVYERRGYYEHSLQRLKEKIKQQLANNRPDFERALSSIPDDAFDYYEELKELFAAIDKGNEQWNIPLYNGGLFQTTVEKKINDLVGVDEDGFPLIAQATPEEILATHNIDNRALIAGFDLLARDEDEKRHGELLMIDYKSLGVRQLGSIYEGLLEFRLRVAAERMVKIKGKMVAEREVLVSKQYRPDPKNIVEANEVYIENDHHERKTTGSYYTPDYIVEYIVANTVGPVIEEKQEQLLQKFRDYEKDVRKKLKDNEALSKMRMNVKPLETILRKPELVDAFFDIKVLDPAMGSGHFLVEAVDYITRSMLAYLNKFPLNPITEALKEIRESILDEMEQQSIAIDQSKLDDINLLKRQVLKRCIYGVDLNPMAVELAKVSVWLDSFTVGAPLSFLDHHMRNGNSLLGARIVDMREAVGSGPRTLFDHNLWISTVNATKEMIRVGKIGDITSEQARESKKTYYSALNVLEPHKKALNVFLSRHYSNPPIVKKQMKNTVDKALDFLRSEKIEEWAKTQNDDLLPEEKKIVLANAQKDAEQSKFFHWDLEFPEVFIDLTISDIKKDGGFDAVIGNPPYVRQEGLGQDKVAFQALYKVYNSIADLYTYFIERGNSMLNPGGRFGMITANKFMRANYGGELRKYLLEKVKLEKLIDFGDLPVFGEAVTYPVIILSKFAKSNTSSISYTVVKNLEFNNLSTLVKETESKLPASAFDGNSWSLKNSIDQKIIGKLKKISMPLLDYIKGEPKYGIKTGYNNAFIINQDTYNRLIKEDAKSRDVLKPFLIGEDVRKYSINFKKRYLIWTYLNIPIKNYPAIFAHLQQYQKQLEQRYDKGNFWWELRPCDYYDKFKTPKIMFPDIANHCQFAYDDNGFYSVNTTYIMPISDAQKGLLAILNSSLIEFFYRTISSSIRGGYMRFIYQYIVQIPIRRINFVTPNEQREYYKQKASLLYQQCISKDDQQCVLSFVEHHLGQEPEASDVVHDLLAMLAEEMLRLNKEKRAQQQEFLDWLVAYLRIQPQPDPKDGKVGLDAMKKKGELLNYPGDYQKGEQALTPDGLHAILLENKKRFMVPWSEQLWPEIEQRYQESLNRVLPLKEQLRKTDALIDQVVYKLYGLTEEEIQVVEGK